MSHIKISRGLNIRLQGEAVNEIIVHNHKAASIGISPCEFPGLVSKPALQPGEKLAVGSVVFYDKYQPDVKFVSPVSGVLSEIVRGEKRKILYYLITPDDSTDFVNFNIPDINTCSRDEVVSFLCASGYWPAFVRRPFGTIPGPAENPDSIFVSFIDTAPLAPDYEFLMADKTEALQQAFLLIAKLCSTKVQVGLAKDSRLADALSKTGVVDIHYVSGPHPAGNVGTLINKIRPLNKGEVIFTIHPNDLLSIGITLKTGRYHAERVVALTGSELKQTGYVKTILGANVQGLIEKNLVQPDVRVVSGNVLTGINTGLNGYLGFKHAQITVIPEGKKYEMLGWIMPGFNKFSMSHTYFSWLFRNKKYRIDTNLKGGHRNYVITGEYEKVCPLDIYPQQLIKAIIVKDIDKMEQLGIYEVLEEDLALCEFVCTSKTEVQSILREGLDLMRSEMS